MCKLSHAGVQPPTPGDCDPQRQGTERTVTTGSVESN